MIAYRLAYRCESLLRWRCDAEVGEVRATHPRAKVEVVEDSLVGVGSCA